MPVPLWVDASAAQTTKMSQAQAELFMRVLRDRYDELYRSA